MNPKDNIEVWIKDQLEEEKHSTYNPEQRGFRLSYQNQKLQDALLRSQRLQKKKKLYEVPENSLFVHLSPTEVTRQTKSFIQPPKDTGPEKPWRWVPRAEPIVWQPLHPEPVYPEVSPLKRFGGTVRAHQSELDFKRNQFNLALERQKEEDKRRKRKKGKKGKRGISPAMERPRHRDREEMAMEEFAQLKDGLLPIFMEFMPQDTFNMVRQSESPLALFSAARQLIYKLKTNVSERKAEAMHLDPNFLLTAEARAAINVDIQPKMFMTLPQVGAEYADYLAKRKTENEILQDKIGRLEVESAFTKTLLDETNNAVSGEGSKLTMRDEQEIPNAAEYILELENRLERRKVEQTKLDRLLYETRLQVVAFYEKQKCYANYISALPKQSRKDILTDFLPEVSPPKPKKREIKYRSSKKYYDLKKTPSPKPYKYPRKGERRWKNIFMKLLSKYGDKHELIASSKLRAEQKVEKLIQEHQKKKVDHENAEERFKILVEKEAENKLKIAQLPERIEEFRQEVEQLEEKYHFEKDDAEAAIVLKATCLEYHDILSKILQEANQEKMKFGYIKSVGVGESPVTPHSPSPQNNPIMGGTY